MDRDEFAEIINEALDESLAKHLGTVHEEISDLRTDLNGLRAEITNEFKSVRKEMRDGFAGVKSEIGGVHNRIDSELFARKDLERRIRKVLPKLPEAAAQ